MHCAIQKPGRVLFGEPMPVGDFSRAEASARSCNAIVVVGSALEVLHVAGLS